MSPGDDNETFEAQRDRGKRIREEIDKVYRQQKQIKEKADAEIRAVGQRTQELSRQCPHLEKHGDAYDSWCKYCDKHMG